MLITSRQFYNTAELKEMIKGFNMLFGNPPEVRIEVRGPNGLPSGVKDVQTGEIAFFPSNGHRLGSIGNKLITVFTGPDIADQIIFSAADNQVTLHAAFYLA